MYQCGSKALILKFCVDELQETLERKFFCYCLGYLGVIGRQEGVLGFFELYWAQVDGVLLLPPDW